MKSTLIGILAAGVAISAAVIAVISNKKHRHSDGFCEYDFEKENCDCDCGCDCSDSYDDLTNDIDGDDISFDDADFADEVFDEELSEELHEVDSTHISDEVTEEKDITTEI